MTLRADNLHLHAGKRTLCINLTLTIRPGQYWGILGQNGSGKTTLLHTLAGLQRPQQGQIYLRNIPIQQLNAKQIAQTIGLLFQDTPCAFPLQISDYCNLSRYPHLATWSLKNTEDDSIIDNALCAMDLLALKHRTLPSLSGGEKRRAAIAALLAQTPSIYLLDEPTNHLDLRYQTEVLRHFQQRTQQGDAVIASLHDINLAEHYCNKVLLLFPDGSHLQGDPKDVLNEHNLTRLYACTFRRQDLLWSVL